MSNQKRFRRDGRLVFCSGVVEALADQFEELDPEPNERMEALQECMERLQEEDQRLLLDCHTGRGSIESFTDGAGKERFTLLGAEGASNRSSTGIVNPFVTDIVSRNRAGPCRAAISGQIPGSPHAVPMSSPPPRAPRSPWVGCAIVLFGVAIFTGLIGYAFWQGTRQSVAIDAITRLDPVVQPVEVLDASAAAALDERIGEFADAVDKGTRGRLQLDRGDLNHLIATREDLAELRGQLRVTSVPGDTIEAEICYPLNRLPWQQGKRYLVGSITLHPELADGEPLLRVTGLSVPGREVPDWFLKQFTLHHLLERYMEDPLLKRRSRQLTAFSAEEGHLVLRSAPWKNP